MTTIVHDAAEAPPAPSVVTIGNFDGVHRGHRVLLRRVVDTAQARDLRAVAVTFDPHPAAILRPGTQPPRLQTVDDRLAALGDAGIDLVVVLAFTPQLAASSPERFVQQVLAGPLEARRVVVGTNFRFGHRAAGDVVTLVECGARRGVEVEAVTLLDLDGQPLSSSLVRRHLSDGNVEAAARALGRPYALRGQVVAGEGRGRTIGVPTANLDVAPDMALPADGVYAGHAKSGDLVWPAVTNVGVRPTFGGTTRTIEVHLLDADVDLYGSTLQVAFAHRIRGEQRFSSAEELVARIAQDVIEARVHLDLDH